MKYSFFTIISCCFLLFIGCKPPKVTTGELTAANEVYFSKKQKIIFASVEQGQAQIVNDPVEGYFERVRSLDMQIQMSSVSRGDKATLRKDYEEYLKEGVMEWTDAEKKYVTAVFNTAFEAVSAIAPDIFPDNLLLIKDNMNHYGEGVFYTREKAIIIPVNTLKEQDKSDFTKTMLHEIYHIYARYNTKKRDLMYARIGYTPIEPPKVPEVLEKRILLNPDGVNFNYSIEVTDKNTNKKMTVMPIIFSKNLSFSPDLKGFFQYLEFALFEVEDGEVKTTRNGTSTVRIKDLTGFYDQIGTNTQYIIHPDEVLADNFTLICLSQNDPDILKEYNIRAEGKTLINDLKAILQQ